MAKIWPILAHIWPKYFSQPLKPPSPVVYHACLSPCTKLAKTSKLKVDPLVEEGKKWDGMKRMKERMKGRIKERKNERMNERTNERKNE